MNTLILSIFKNRPNADMAADDLLKKGIDSQNISIVMKDETSTTSKETAAVGAATGGIIGGITGLLVGIGAIIIPGIGSVLVGGPLVALLGLSGAMAIAATTVSGGITGAIAGGLIGALVGLGLPEEEAKLYETHIKEGAILLAVTTTEPEKEAEIKDILTSNSAAEIKTLQVKEPSVQI